MWELKPLLFCDLYGTTQIVPCHKSAGAEYFRELWEACFDTKTKERRG
jgi:hypothetical protein